MSTFIYLLTLHVLISLRTLMYPKIVFSLKQSPIVKTETISFGSVSSGGEKMEISMKEVPVVHTETKTITYESSEVITLIEILGV